MQTQLSKKIPLTHDDGQLRRNMLCVQPFKYFYVPLTNLHKDLDMETVDSVIRKYAQSHEQRLHRHINVAALQLLNNGGLFRRLKRTKPFELM
jgi:hypothetical protein